MENIITKVKRPLLYGACLIGALFMLADSGYAQDSTAAAVHHDSTATSAHHDSTAAAAPEPPSKPRPVKNTFASDQIIDAQTVMVPIKGTFEADIQHRFGSVQNGYEDLWGIYGIANIRFGFLYTPIDNLEIGFGLAKVNMLWDGSAKYSIFKQDNAKIPVSVTYYGNAAVKTVKNPDNVLFTYNSQRWSFFNEIMIARKINDKLSVQIGFSMSHQNSVPGYYTKVDTSNVIFKEQKFNMYSFSFCMRYKLTEGTSFIFDYEQPLTAWATDNPHPNFGFGLEFNTSGHTFQLFADNFTFLNTQQNAMYNANNPFGYTSNGEHYPGGQFHIGFNITRLWNF